MNQIAALAASLLIGDSILNGYSKEVAAALNGRAHVDLWNNPYNQRAVGQGSLQRGALLKPVKRALPSPAP